MSGELTEENLNRIFDEAGRYKPDTFLISKKQLDELKRLGAIKYDRVKCSWELLGEKLWESPPKSRKDK